MAGTRIFFQLFLYLFIHALFPGQVQAQNRTFSMVTINSANSLVNNKNVVRASNANPSGIGVGFSDPAPLTVFVYNQKMYMKCSTSPTGACIGYLQKNFGGALKGWNFQFWPNENFPTTNPIGSYAGSYSVRNINGMDLLVDAGTGSNEYPSLQLCPYPGVTNSPYAITSATDNSACIYGTRFRVLYSDANKYPQYN